MPKIALEITGLLEILGRDTGLKNPIGDLRNSQSIKIGVNPVIFNDWWGKSVKIDKLNCCVKSMLSIFSGLINDF